MSMFRSFPINLTIALTLGGIGTWQWRQYDAREREFAEKFFKDLQKEEARKTNALAKYIYEDVRQDKRFLERLRRNADLVAPKLLAIAFNDDEEEMSKLDSNERKLLKKYVTRYNAIKHQH